MRFRTLLGLILAPWIALSSAQAGTLDEIKARGALNCGVSTGQTGFSQEIMRDDWTGFDVDFCRALAAAIFNDAGKVKFVKLSAKDRFRALLAGEVDLLARHSAWTMERDTKLHMKFAAITFFDAQGIMVRRSLGAVSVLQLTGASVCVQNGTGAPASLADFFRMNGMKYTVQAFDDIGEMIKAYEGGRCTVISAQSSVLQAVRLALPVPDDHVILPEPIAKAPLGPIVRQDDDGWFNIVKWTHFALINAEELGVGKANIDEQLASAHPDVRRLLGKDGTFGADLGLSNAWAAQAIRAVGNYGEIFERNLGAGSPLKLARGVNALWTQGGLHYAPPIR